MGSVARSFNNDSLLDLAAGGGANIGGGPLTVAFMAYLNDTANGAIVHALNAASSNVWWIEVFGGNWDFGVGTSGFDNCPYAATTSQWTLLAMTKTTGSSMPRWHRYLYDGTPTWEHANGTTALPVGSTPTSTGRFRLGQWQNNAGERLNGRIECLLIKDSVMTDGDIETLSGSFQAWENVNATILVRLNQAAVTTAVTDLSATGTADEIARTATTVTTGNPDFPDSSGGGSVAPDGIAVAVTLGTPAVSQELPLVPSGIALPVALGTPSVSLALGVEPEGAAVSVTLGTPSVSQAPSVAPAGLAAPVALGAVSVAQPLTVEPAGVALPVTLGSPSVTWSGAVSPDGIGVPVELGGVESWFGRRVVTRPNDGVIERPYAGVVLRP